MNSRLNYLSHLWYEAAFPLISLDKNLNLMYIKWKLPYYTMTDKQKTWYINHTAVVV